MKRSGAILLFFGTLLLLCGSADAEVRAWQGSVIIPTYGWQDDINPKFWAMEAGPRGSKTVKSSIVYPYTMQDHLSRTKANRTYKALFLENEYLKVTCLPELGGRIHSVLDKTTGQEMFHLNQAVKPGMIAMRGAFISGGIEFNTGPHGHTVTILSPVDAVIGKNDDGSAYIEISNIEKIFRTRWTVIVTLHPSKAYLHEKIRIFNPTDTTHPYYFWNCTAFPCDSGTRFIYPMSLGTGHRGEEFFTWPIHEGKDLSWLKNYPKMTSVFAVNCTFDFFGAYNVTTDRGIVQFANHKELPGKKAWTWGTSDSGLVNQQNLTDKGGPYIEVQSGPLPTQRDYGMLGPGQEVAWQEWWYPVHGLGDGFEFATKDIAIETKREKDKLKLHMLTTSPFPGAVCELSADGGRISEKRVDLSPEKATLITFKTMSDSPVKITVKNKDGGILAQFINPLPIPVVSAPNLPEEKSDEQLTIEEKYLKGVKYDRATSRKKARKYYEMAVADDEYYRPALRALAVLDIEAGLYEKAIERLDKALERKPDDDGLAWYFMAVSYLRLGNEKQAIDCAYRASRCFGTASIGYDLVGRCYMRLKKYPKAIEAFNKAVKLNPNDTRNRNHLILALYASGDTGAAYTLAGQRVAQNPTDLTPRMVLALQGKAAMTDFVSQARGYLGEDDFEIIETSLVLADVGLLDEALKLLRTASVDAVAHNRRNPLVLYYLAYYCSLQNDHKTATNYLDQAGKTHRDFIFPSRTEAIDVLKYAVSENPEDSYAHLLLGNLYGDLGRLDEAADHWTKAGELNPSLSVAFRNLGLYHITNDRLPKAGEFYNKAIKAQPNDQTLYRDLADILIATGKRDKAIELLETMPFEKIRRAEIIILFAKSYKAEQRYTDAIDLLESTPYFVNWEGQTITWRLFSEAHIERGKEHFENKQFESALKDFEAALTYPENIGVGRPPKPKEAVAQYFRARALLKLDRHEQARKALQAGADLPESTKEQNKYRLLCKEALLVLTSASPGSP